MISVVLALLALTSLSSALLLWHRPRVFRSGRRSAKQVWVAVIVLDADGRILLARRCNPGAIDNGLFGPPGGKVDVGEGVIAAAIREFHEETGAHLANPMLFGVDDTDRRGVVFFVGGEVYGDIGNPERDKQDDWRFVDPRTVLLQIGMHSFVAGTFFGLRKGFDPSRIPSRRFARTAGAKHDCHTRCGCPSTGSFAGLDA